jgi:hypothetical protein
MNLTETAFQVPIVFDYVATFTWAVSGAIVAIRRRYDITGVFIVALLAALGGGLTGRRGPSGKARTTSRSLRHPYLAFALLRELADSREREVHGVDALSAGR